ncbi:GNAT family N-acetyltransferase [Streptomyces corynorhini]|uniref:N-acetyltransferase n=1 Tax=Streptomyces corynorhini TaxID=2282652 RepID=A0A370AS24_9ACTN|nr:GNAT family N-acetyltransferase [Streptomyces corynorhini]RDG30454.1 N-acetyltransferase [Streptomyces corynorhini]
MEPVTLTTERLLLRPFTPADADAVNTACQDPDIQRWTTIPSPYERQHAQHFVERIAPDGWRDDTAYAFGVRLGADGPPLGAVALQFPRSGAWEVGYWTAPGHRGRGYTTEAVRAISHWAFTALGAVRVEWRAEVGNAGSRAVAEKAGFTLEGTLRGGLLNKETLRDCWVGGLLPHDLGLPGRHPYLPARG